MCALMLVSREKNRFREVDDVRVTRGQFQTLGRSWLAPQVVEFIVSRSPSLLYDPFAGRGNLLASARERVPCPIAGLDIDPAAGWPVNDSLRSIPARPGAVIVTNPPYLAGHSARRKGVHGAVARHFERHCDLYQLALDRCREASAHVVAIVPETIINSGYPKDNIASITILEENPFSDTDCPVCVVCIDTTLATPGGPAIYVGEKPIGPLGELERKRLHPGNRPRIDFNVKSGRIALRAVDLANPARPVRFMRRQELDYPPERIKVSSRLVTFVEIPSVPDDGLDRVILAANRLLAGFRADTADVLLSPFKGNTTEGRRRRRLDYYTARAILERAVLS
jgi:hypothetical protein